jgi:hypothetical protein
MNKSNAANRNAGGNWRGPGFGNRRDNQKFGNRNQNKDNKRFRDGKGRVDQTEKVFAFYSFLFENMKEALKAMQCPII